MPKRLMATMAFALFASSGQALAHGWRNPFPVGGGFPAQATANVAGDVTATREEMGAASNRITRPTGSTSALLRGATPNFAAKKGRSAPWLAKATIPWKSRFVTPQQGYAVDMAGVDRSLKASVADGGWERDARPSVVVLYDPTSKAHRNALQTLDKDVRARAAAHLFNCFKVDAKTIGDAPKKLIVRTYDAKGKVASELTGARATQVFDAMSAAWKSFGKSELSKVVVRADALVSGLAWCDYQLAFIERKIICPDCGHEREDVVENIDQTRIRKAGVERALLSLR